MRRGSPTSGGRSRIHLAGPNHPSANHVPLITGSTIRLAGPHPGASPMANDRPPCERASTSRPAPAPAGSGGRLPIGPGTAGGARCRLIRPAPRSSSARPGPRPHARRVGLPAGSRRPGRPHSSGPRPAPRARRASLGPGPAPPAGRGGRRRPRSPRRAGRWWAVRRPGSEPGELLHGRRAHPPRKPSGAQAAPWMWARSCSRSSAERSIGGPWPQPSNTTSRTDPPPAR